MALLEVRNLVKEFTRKQGLFRAPSVVRAVDDVSFSIEAGETFGLVGESGSGKTTTGRCILRLIEPTSGAVQLQGRGRAGVLARAACARRAATCRSSSRIPTRRSTRACASATIVEEPLIIHQHGHRRPSAGRASPSCFSWSASTRRSSTRYPHEFSGGQRQRIGLARALALNPSLVIADEPVSALDVSVQAQVVNLLMDLQERLKLTYLFIAHDLRLVRHICERVAVMYLGTDRRDGHDRVAVRRARAPLHARAAVGDPGAGSDRAAAAHGARSGVVRSDGGATRSRQRALGGCLDRKLQAPTQPLPIPIANRMPNPIRHRESIELALGLFGIWELGVVGIWSLDLGLTSAAARPLHRAACPSPPDRRGSRWSRCA